MNSAFMGPRLSRRKVGGTLWNTRVLRQIDFVGGDFVVRDTPPVYSRLRVDSRTTSSGATFRWVAATSLFSSTPLIPSITMPTAEAPIDSIGWRTVVSAGV